MNFLELAQKLASESGTVNNPTTQLPTVLGQTGRLKKIVGWVQDAYHSIQVANEEWRWLQDEFQSDTVAGTQRYPLGTWIAGGRFASLNVRGEYDYRFTFFRTADGAAGEGPLIFLPWETFYATQLKGAKPAGRPQFFSVSPAEEFCISPTPDDAYTVRGPYQKSPQALAADADTPEMPARFHPVIVSAALDYLAINDEAMSQLPLWRLRKLREWGPLEMSQLPPIEMAGALA